jgi:hypothetical protein
MNPSEAQIPARREALQIGPQACPLANKDAWLASSSTNRSRASVRKDYSTIGTDMGHQIGEYVVKSVMQPAVTGSR